WILSNNVAHANGDSGFGLFGGTSTLSGNTSTRNGHHGYDWHWDASGTSTGDLAQENSMNGVLIDTRSKERVTLENMTAFNNQSMGLRIASGTANVNGGHFSNNTLDGIQAGAGSLVVKSV